MKKEVKIVRQGNFYSLYYDGVLHTHQFPISTPLGVVKLAVKELMPNYIIKY